MYNAAKSTAMVHVIKVQGPLLAPSEMRQHPREAQAGILEELKTWAITYQTIEIADREPGMNSMSSMFVANCAGSKDEKSGEINGVIRMRLALRGFEDWYSQLYESYSGTASRLSQRLVASETACRAHEGWVLSSFDVEKAFLQGMTYEELHRTTGEPPRRVHFSLPKGASNILQQLPGYEHFDERYHCLRALIPATGTGDAPRAFNLKLSSVLHGHGYRPTKSDPNLRSNMRGRS